MKVIDPGHMYDLDFYDDEGPGVDLGRIIKFMKREGPGYPGNVGTYPGTNLQEVIRVLIDRVKYLDHQIHNSYNTLILANLRDCIFFLEVRAADRHNLLQEFREMQFDRDKIEDYPTCHVCGHILCHHKQLGDANGGGGSGSTNVQCPKER